VDTDRGFSLLAHVPTQQREEEAAWIEAAKIAPAAFEPLYLRYRSAIYAYLRTRLESDEDAADLTQQVFLQALAALPRYQQRGVPFAVWLFRIARHLALNHCQRYRSCVSWDALPAALQPSSGQDLEANWIHQEALLHLKTLLKTLSPAQRELLALRFAAGLRAPQIAAIVGKQPEAIKKQITRLIHAFKEAYHHEEAHSDV
jgi:RNA polymerase sigma-70 factor (ECF subfamily)